MTNSKVSIIIPSYNSALYIKEAVDSATGQTYENVEVIVVDDGSTDNTKEILSPYFNVGKIKYIYEENKGLAGARNTGIKNSSGEYIAFLDADDLFMPEKIGEQVEVLRANNSYDVCYSDLIHFDESGKTYHHRYKYPSGNILAPLLYKQFINPLTVMARRDIFDKYGYFDESLRRSEDWDMWLRLTSHGVNFFYLDKVLAKYRIRSIGNLSSIESEPEMKEKNLLVFQRLEESLPEKEREKYCFENIIKILRVKLVFAYLMVGDKDSAMKSSKELPLFWGFIIRLLPRIVWKFLLGYLRKLKHSLLLKRI